MFTRDRFQTNPVQRSDRIGLLFTRDLSGTGPERIQTGPAVLQVQFLIRSGPVPERSLVNIWIGSKRFPVNRSRSGLVRFGTVPVHSRLNKALNNHITWRPRSYLRNQHSQIKGCFCTYLLAGDIAPRLT